MFIIYIYIYLWYVYICDMYIYICIYIIYICVCIYINIYNYIYIYIYYIYNIYICNYIYLYNYIYIKYLSKHFFSKKYSKVYESLGKKYLLKARPLSFNRLEMLWFQIKDRDISASTMWIYVLAIFAVISLVFDGEISLLVCLFVCLFACLFLLLLLPIFTVVTVDILLFLTVFDVVDVSACFCWGLFVFVFEFQNFYEEPINQGFTIIMIFNMVRLSYFSNFQG